MSAKLCHTYVKNGNAQMNKDKSNVMYIIQLKGTA